MNDHTALIKVEVTVEERTEEGGIFGREIAIASLAELTTVEADVDAPYQPTCILVDELAKQAVDKARTQLIGHQALRLKRVAEGEAAQ